MTWSPVTGSPFTFGEKKSLFSQNYWWLPPPYPGVFPLEPNGCIKADCLSILVDPQDAPQVPAGPDHREHHRCRNHCHTMYLIGRGPSEGGTWATWYPGSSLKRVEPPRASLFNSTLPFEVVLVAKEGKGRVTKRRSSSCTSIVSVLPLKAGSFLE